MTTHPHPHSQGDKKRLIDIDIEKEEAVDNGYNLFRFIVVHLFE